MIHVILQNRYGGELACKPSGHSPLVPGLVRQVRFARSEEEAAEVAIQIIRETGFLSDGDQIVIEGNEEDCE